MTSSFKRSLLATTLLGGVAISTPAFAQNAQTPPTCPPGTPAGTNGCVVPEVAPAQVAQAAPAPAPAPASTETIVVTGSRIASPNITSIQPVQVVGEQEIKQSGASNIQDVLQENPAVGAPLFSRTNQAFTTTGGGLATVDLRGLGPNRTLVLINGRRVVGGVANSPIVDLNVIPTQFLERVDILTGGASSLYGSDAVSGVVNFIYKRNFEGVLAEGQYGITERGDTPTYQISLTTGANVADGRGNIMVHIGYSNEGQLLSRERKNTRIDNLSKFWYFTGDPKDYFTAVEPFFSSFPVQGRFVAGGTTFTFGPTGQLQSCFTSSGTSCVGPLGPGTGPNGFNRQFFRSLAVPVRRYIFAATGHYDITNNISTILEATYVKTQSHSEIEPFGLDSGGANPVYPSGVIPIETFVNGVPVLNPLVPAPIAAAATDSDGDGLKDIVLARRLVELGKRQSDTDRDFFRLVTGLQGKILNDRFNWDVTYNIGITTNAQNSTGQPLYPNLRSALAAIPGPNGTVVCADPVAVAAGCVPINVFGAGSISPQAAAYINAEQNYRTQLKQQVWAANISGSVFDLPAGPLGLALGAEYRKESSFSDWDALTNLGLNGANAAPDTHGQFSVKEAYGEVNVPVLKDLPFARQLDLRAAGRISDYTTIGSVKTWSVGADYAPVEDVRFRATVAKAVRAPNIGELFTGPSQTFPTGLVDPCKGIGLVGGGALGDNCRAAPGVIANINANGGVFTQTQADQQGISGFNAGNPNLGPETAKSFTAGVVINPRSISALRNLVLSVDYYNIRIADAITFPDRATILGQCYNQGNPAFCQFIIRRPTAVGSSSAGSLAFVNSGAVNSGGIKERGIDTVLQYRRGLGQILGAPLNMNLRLAWTHLLEGWVIPLPGAPTNFFAGEIGSARDRVNGTLGFQSARFGWSLTGNYIGKSYEDDISLLNFTGNPPHAVVIKPQFYLDTQLSFTPVRSYEFYFGVDNLLDHQAPIILQGSIFNTTGSKTDESVYDIFGRRYYAGVRLKF